MRWCIGFVVVGMGCGGGGTEPCEATVEGWNDADGDGFGAGEPEAVCKLGDLVDNGSDCNDDDPAIFPGAEEQCNGVDDDCNGELDNGQDLKNFYADADGDGFGFRFPAQLACENPGDGWVKNQDDCDDEDPDIHPDAQEVCNAGVDDDCDGLSDDQDETTDPETKTPYFLDEDLDGLGNPDVQLDLCAPRSGYVDNDFDCDDSDETITQFEFYEDADLDGYGRAGKYVLSCAGYEGAATNDLDCDDTDPLVNLDQNWYIDDDGDGAGMGSPVAFQCLPPYAGTAPEQAGSDCDDSDPLRAPHFTDICEDGIDQDCTGTDRPCISASCKLYLDADPTLPSGVYQINPGGVYADVYCDMTTDGGGWTLVASSAGATPDDAAGAYDANLTTLTPATPYTQVWSGMRPLMGAISDIRFACKQNPGAPGFTVDLSYYDNDWYDTITTGTELQSCFNDNNGVGAGVPPERRNNVNGATRPMGDQWAAGYLEGEDFCDDTGDFTVDFDDRGMDSNQSDGTDWGEDDSSMKCGTSGLANGAWFIFVREQ